jgi:hypothetical protein
MENYTMARPRKFDSEHHRRLRAKISAEVEHKRLMSLTQRGGDQSTKVFMYESVDEFGHPIDVIISSESEPGLGEIRSRFLPSIPIVPKLAKLIREARLAQVAQWRDSAG